MSELKPCPFCSDGGDVEASEFSPVVECGDCGCEQWGDTIKDAIEKWNTRPALTLSDERIAQIATSSAVMVPKDWMMDKEWRQGDVERAIKTALSEANLQKGGE